MSKKRITRGRRRLHAGRIIGCSIVALTLCAGTLYSIEKYNNPPLHGTWKSQETGESIKFNKNGTVKINHVEYVPEYEILSATRMQYNIQDKQFEMAYRLDGRILEWGMSPEQMETFERQ